MTLTPLPTGRAELEGVGVMTKKSVNAARVEGVQRAALEETLFAPMRRRRDEAIARTMRRAP